MFKNQIKTILLLGLLTGLLIAVGGLVGGRLGLLIGLVFSLGMNFVMYWWSDKIVLKMYRAKEADKSTYFKLHEMVRDISRKAGIPKPKVYLVSSPHPNAFATGRSPAKGVVAFTTGILNLLDEKELRGVAAHEIAHIKNRDSLIMTIAAGIAGVISYFAMIARWGAIFGGFGRDNDNGGIFEFLALAILAPIMAMIIQMAISRSREYIADATGAAFIRDGEGLALALEKLEKGISHRPLRANGGTEATAHLFIENPFRGRGLWKIFSTHPSTQERVAKLRAMKL